MLWRDDVKPGGGLAVRVDIERCGSSVLDELVLDVLMFMCMWSIVLTYVM